MEEFANRCDRSKGYISMLENGNNPKSGKAITPSIETVAKIAAAMRISVDDLLHMVDGTQRVLLEDDVANVKGAFKPEFKKTVPILGRIAAGTPITAVENIEYYVKVENENIDFGLLVKGDSMYPTVLSESTVFIQQDAEIDNGAIVVAIVNGDEATIKRFYRYGDRIALRPDNINHQEQIYAVEEVTILGRVIKMEVSFV